MSRAVLLAVFVVGSCGNDLPSPGTCAVPGAEGIAPPVGEPVALASGSVGWDDLRFSAELGRVIAAPAGPGMLYLVDPETADVTAIPGLPASIASADAGDGVVFVADRAADAIVMVDPAGAVLGTFAVGSSIDYVRYSHASHELWVTEPRSDRIEVLSFTAPATLAKEATIAVAGGPEGLVFDAAGARAYANAAGFLDAIDVAERRVIGHWRTGCGGSHGFPVVDDAFGLVFAGCSDSGGAAVLTTGGELRAGFELGDGEAILAYAPDLHRFYLRGDPGTEVGILGVCEDGSLSLLGRATAAMYGHAAAADDRGGLWVADAGGGGLLRYLDPYP